MSEKVQRCDPDDPNRCQALIRSGTSQCSNMAYEGSNYCALHGGGPSQNEKLRNYNLTRWKRQITEKSNSPILKQLHEEIGLLRFILESIINSCENENDLIVSSGPIAELVCKIEKLVVSCNTLDTKLNNTLDKNQLLKFASTIIDIIANTVSDADEVDIVAEQIIKALGDETTFEVD